MYTCITNYYILRENRNAPSWILGANNNKLNGIRLIDDIGIIKRYDRTYIVVNVISFFMIFLRTFGTKSTQKTINYNNNNNNVYCSKIMYIRLLLVTIWT